MQTDDPWSLGGSPSPARTDADTPPPHTLEEALLALDHTAASVFAVLDGAQFDNLPNDLLMGDFVSRPLYLDRGDNNSDQIVTAPHMVWLDERTEKITGRAPKETIPALMALIGDRPAAVFWQCPAGAEALYRHLRGINMVYLPRNALSETDRLRSHNKVEPALLRHADSNVVAQLLASLNTLDTARLFGPADKILAKAEPAWSGPAPYLAALKPINLPKAEAGAWHVSRETIASMEEHRATCLRRKAVDEFMTASGEGRAGADRRMKQILAAFDRGLSYGLEEMNDIWGLIALDLKYGQEFESRPIYSDALYELTNTQQPPAARIHYATLYCANVGVT